jgi:hypothetical protein
VEGVLQWEPPGEEPEGTAECATRRGGSHRKTLDTERPAPT